MAADLDPAGRCFACHEDLRQSQLAEHLETERHEQAYRIWAVTGRATCTGRVLDPVYRPWEARMLGLL